MPASLAEYKLGRLDYLRDLQTQADDLRRQETPSYDTPGALAVDLDPRTVQTTALDLVDEAIVWAFTSPGARLIISMPPQEGKLIADGTPVPTPSGWTLHGDLRPGSIVFHPTGRQIKVADVHAPAEASLRVHFSDHTSILVHPAHEWTVWDRGRARWMTLETRQLAAVKLSHGTPGKRGHKYRFHLPLRDALDCVDSDLPIEPYTLGVWLGDGSTTKAAVTHHRDDSYRLAYPETACCVHPTTGIITTYFGGGMLADLRRAGVLGNKHIPSPYLRASAQQRRALLAGLIDTDGHVSASGQVSFDNANAALVQSAAELVRSLGYRAHVHRPTPPKLSSSGIQGKQEMWRVTFTPHDQGPARLARKAAVKFGRRERIAIISITVEKPQIGRCITVDSEDGLYLVGEGMLPTHNSERVTKTGSLWALHRDPELRIGIVSYSQPLAEGFGRAVRNWIATFNGDEGTLDLGLRIARDNGSARRWQLDRRRGGIVCVGIGSGLTGRPLDALVIDDPIADKEQAASAYHRDRVWDWWQSVGSTRLAPGAPVILILTRWHEDDLAGRLLAAEDGHRWRVINIPALADHDPARGQSDPLGRQPGEWLTSARGRTVAEWEEIRIQAGSRVFNALYQGRPSPDSGNVWQRQWWRRYTVPLWSQHPDLPDAYRVDECDELVMSWDMAFKDTKSSDFVVGQVWARRGANVYLLDQVHKRLSFTDTVTAFKAMVARWPQATAKYVEDKANGTAIIDTLRSKVPGIVAVTPTESKYARANAVAPVIEAGNAFLPDPSIALFDTESLVDEAAAFPNGAHDDQVDATSQALAELLLDGTGAQAWIDYVRRLAQAPAVEAKTDVTQVPGPEPAATPDHETVADPVEARRRARTAAYRNQQNR